MKKKLSIQDIANHLVQNEDISKKDAEDFVRAFFEVVEEGLHEDNFVKIKGFGTFKLVSVNERESINVNTGERIQISGHTKVTFTPDTQMKELVNRPFAHFESVDLNDDTEISEFEVIDEAMQRLEDEEEEDESEINTDESETVDSEPQTTLTQPIVEQEQITTPIELMGNDEESTHATASLEQPTPRTQIEENEEVENEDKGENREGAQIGEPTSPTSQSSSDSLEADNNLDNLIELQTKDDNSSTHETETAEDIVVTAPAPIVESDSTSVETTNNTNPSSSSESTTNSEVETSSTNASDVPPKNPTNVTVGYTYEEVPMPHSHRNGWKVLALVLCVFILMVASYFVGYYRILCPTCYDMHWPFNLHNEVPMPQAPAPRPSVPTASSKPLPHPVDSVSTSASIKSDTTAISEKLQPKAKETSSDSSAQSRPKTHCIKEGDNLSKISRKYYGSDKYVQKIIEVNHLKDANNITVGKDIILP